jgi:ribosomal protein S18 acetylase RimI-like enzyme
MSGRPGAVRLMRPDEAADVGRVTVDAYVYDGFLTRDDQYTAELAQAAHRSTAAEVWVYEAGGDVAGTVTFCPPGSEYREVAVDGEGEFRMLAVSPAARGCGVAKALIDLCFARCRELGLTALVLCTLPAMTNAHGLYRSFGFERDESLDWSPTPEILLIGYRASV